VPEAIAEATAFVAREPSGDPTIIGAVGIDVLNKFTALLAGPSKDAALRF
jgi:hypothetical protein